MFLVDSSKGLSKEDYKREKDFVKSLASHFNLHPSGARGTVIIYGDRPSTVARYTDPDFSERLDSARLLGTPKRTDRALELASRILSASKAGDRKILVLVTAGPQSPSSKPYRDYAEPLRKLATQTFVVVIGQEPTNRDILPLVDRLQDIIRVPAFDRLSSQSRQISKQIRDKPGRCHF